MIACTSDSNATLLDTQPPPVKRPEQSHQPLRVLQPQGCLTSGTAVRTALPAS